MVAEYPQAGPFDPSGVASVLPAVAPEMVMLSAFAYPVSLHALDSVTGMPLAFAYLESSHVRDWVTAKP